MSYCPFEIAKKILDNTFPEIPSLSFSTTGDRCYCLKCHQERGDRRIYCRGKPSKSYALPIGWQRFGLKIDEAKCLLNNAWKDWHVAFHGTTKDTILNIFKSGLILLKSGDITIGGHKLDNRKGHITKSFRRINKYSGTHELFDPNQIYISPSIKYSGHNVYAKPYHCKHPLNPTKNITVQFAFQLRIRPNSYCIGQETIGATRKGITLDNYFSNDELEWYTKESTGIILHGLLIRFKECNSSFGLRLSSAISIDDEKYDDKKEEMESEYKIITRLKKENEDLKQSYLKIKNEKEKICAQNSANNNFIQIFMHSILDRTFEEKDDKNCMLELSGMYELYSSVPCGYAKIAETMKKYICNLGYEYIAKSKKKIFDDLDDHQLIESLINLHNKFLNIVKNELHEELIFHTALKESFEEIINKTYYTHGLLAHFVSDILKKDSKLLAKYDGDIWDVVMDNVIMLYGYIHDKDIFERDYQQYLASRLLLDLSESEQSERLMINKLSTESGYHWISRIIFAFPRISKLEDMFKDIQRSKELMVDFRKKYDFEFELNVSVCTWPTRSIQLVKKPDDIADVSEKFTQFYSNRFSGRRLHFQMDKGNADVSVQFNDKTKKILIVSTYQMMVLLQFNHKNIWTFIELLDITRIPNKDLMVTLLSMAHPKVKVLQKAPNTKEVSRTDKFRINPKYTNPRDKIQIQILNIRGSKYQSQDEILEDRKMTAARRLRHHQLDAAIVRIMKTRRQLKHNELLSEVRKYLKRQFAPKTVDIKKRIARLIDMEYLERDNDDRELYHYKL